MWRVRDLLLRLVNALWRGRAEDQLSREMAAHLACLEDEFRRQGMSPEEARLAARRRFGAIEQAKEAQRDARSFLWLDDARRDVGYAFRTLRRAPGFATVAILTLGLGIGAVTVIYSVLRNVVLEPFPYADGDRMVDVVIRDRSDRLHRGALPVPEFLDYQEQSTVFEDVAGAAGIGMHYEGPGGAQRVSVVLLTPNSFSFLGVAPLYGRAFGPADAALDAPPVAVLNHRTWMTVFGGDSSMLGRTITLDGRPRTIVGIMPPRFEWHVGDFWIPSPISRGMVDADRTFRWFQARLRRRVSIEQAEAQLNVIARRRAAAFPREYPEGTRVQVITIIDWVVGRFRQTLYTLFAAVVLLLVIACCNVANMLLARATAREREFTVRAALGASRGRIIRQLLIESAALAAGGTALGIALAYGGVRALASVMPRQGVAWEVQLRIDQPALLFALATAVVATLTFGLTPAFSAARRDLIGSINTGGRSGTAAPRQRRLRSGLVIGEVVLSVVLLLGAGLLMRTFVSMVSVDLGFDTRNLLQAGVSFAPGHTQSVAARQQFYSATLDRMRRLPGVLSPAVASSVLGGWRTAVEIPGVDLPDQSTGVLSACSEGFARTLGLQLVRGRHLSAADVTASRKVTVINQTLVERYFGGRDPIGRTIRFPRMTSLPAPVADPTFEVVGIVRDVINQAVTDPVSPHAFVPHTVPNFPNMTLVVRTSGEPMAVFEPLRRAVQEIDRGVAVSRPTTVEEDLQQWMFARPRFNVIVLGIFAATGLVLVALGIYGVVSYTVSEETRQIAIRVALGGERRHVLRMVLQGGLVLVAIGLGIGVLVGLMTNRLLETVLWNVTPQDPLTVAGTIALILAIGIAACAVPAWRAMRVDPIVALRHE